LTPEWLKPAREAAKDQQRYRRVRLQRPGQHQYTACRSLQPSTPAASCPTTDPFSQPQVPPQRLRRQSGQQQPLCPASPAKRSRDNMRCSPVSSFMTTFTPLHCQLRFAGARQSARQLRRGH
jgi:hypothetical protein